MRFLIELDGPVFDIAAAHYAAYHRVAGELGWSRLDPTTYWRLIRSKGRDADILPGAKELKIEQYQLAFPSAFECVETLSRITPQENVRTELDVIREYGILKGVTLGTNVKDREVALERAGVAELFAEVTALSQEPSSRPSELRNLSGGDRRTVVVAASDEVVRAAANAELFCVGVSSGSCSKPRLQRAGPGVVYSSLGELRDSLQSGARDMIKAGLLPPSHDV